MMNELTWQSICFALSVNEATIAVGGIYYKGQVYRQTHDRKRLEAWDSKKNTWVVVK